MASEVVIRLLGPVCVEQDGVALELGPARQRAVFAVLVIAAPQPVAVEQILDRVWGFDVPATGHAVVHSYMHRLRKQVGPALAIRRGAQGYSLDTGGAAVDVNLAEALSAAASAAHDRGDELTATARLAEAITLWRGEALGGLPGPYLAAHRARLQETRWSLVERRIGADLALGRHHELVTELAEFVGLQPLREDLRAHHILALHRCGRTADALAAYDQARRAFADELGTEPGPALRALHDRLLHQDPALDRPSQGRRPAQLPADLADFTGREHQAAAIAATLTTPAETPRLAVITGSGGVGKTALAIHVAHRVRTAFPDGQIHLNLRGFDELPAGTQGVLADVLSAFGITAETVPAGIEARSALLRTVLADRRVLLVVDNAATAAQVRPLLPGAGGSAVVVTSRHPLADLAGAHRTALDILPSAQARDLFDRIVGVARSTGEEDHTASVLAVCDGLPLAIRIGASRLAARPDWSIATLAQRLHQQHRTLDELAVGDVSVRASLAVSYHALATGATTERAAAPAFRLLGLAAEVPSISPDAAAALLGLPLPRAEQVLDALIDINLLAVDVRGHYRAHDLVRLFAAERSDQEPAAQRHAAIGRLLDWYLHSATAASTVLNPNRSHAPLDDPPRQPAMCFDNYDEALRWLDTEQANLVAAVRLAMRHGRWAHAWKLPVELWDLLTLQGQWHECAKLNELGVQAATELGDQHAQAWLLNNLAGAQLQCEQPRQALDSLLRAREINRQRGDHKVEGTNLYNIAVAHHDLGQVTEAMAAMHQAWQIHHDIGYQYGAGLALSTLGSFHLGAGQPREAADHFQRALAVLGEIGHDYSTGYVLSNLSESQLALGRLADAERTAREAVAVNHRIGHRVAEAESRLNLGMALRALGDPGQARQEWLAALDVLDQPDQTQLTDRLHGLLAATDPAEP